MNKNIKVVFIILLSILMILSFNKVSAKVSIPELENVMNKNPDGSARINDGAIKNDVSVQAKLEEYRKAGLFKGLDQKRIDEAIGAASLVDESKTQEFDNAFNNFVKQYNTVISYALTFATISSFLIFMVIFLRLTLLPDHSIQRRKAMTDIVTSGIAVALLGAINIVIKIYYSPIAPIIDSQIMYYLDWRATANILLYEFRFMIVGFFGLATLTTILMFIRALMKLASSGGNPGKRAEAVTNLWFTIAGTAGLGSITLFVSYFTNILKY